LDVYLDIVDNLEANVAFENVVTGGEPMLSRHGLYPSIGGSLRQGSRKASPDQVRSPKRSQPSSPEHDEPRHNEPDSTAYSWLAFFGDGKRTLLEIAAISGLPVVQLYKALMTLKNVGIIVLRPFPSQAP
jgi:aminopeptidase-like protein